MRKIFLILLLVILSLASCSKADIEEELPTARPTKTLEAEPTIDMDIPLTLDELSDTSDWVWKKEYGYYVVNNDRWDFLTVWYDPFEKGYTISHPYSSLSDEHILNGTKVFPLNRHYINENGNVFIPFRLADLKYPDYEADGDGIFWLLYENINGNAFLEYYSNSYSPVVSITNIS